MADHEPTMDGGCPEPELTQELRDALTLLHDHSDSDEFRTLIDDVLGGRCSLTEASSTAAFGDVVFAGIAQEFARLTDDDKQRLATQAQSPPAHSPQAAVGSCGAPCATCTSLCALAGPASE
ncbi:MAG: hypothetical protein ACRDTX_21365 [Pseudonocardiaceae bacterium]